MRYLGNKSRLAKELAPILMKNLNGDNWYMEPFVGATGMMQAINYPKRVGSDINPYIIALMRHISEGYNFNDYKIDENLYNEVKKNINDYLPALVGFLGFGCSFGGKWFGGFARSEGRNLVEESLRNIEKLAPKIKDVKFLNGSYEMYYFEKCITKGDVYYCDIPYQGTTKYSNDFNYEEFWNWARIMSKYNWVYISEYNAPDDFECIWKKEHKVGIHHNLENHNKSVEKLFIYKGGKSH